MHSSIAIDPLASKQRSASATAYGNPHLSDAFCRYFDRFIRFLIGAPEPKSSEPTAPSTVNANPYQAI